MDKNNNNPPVDPQVDVAAGSPEASADETPALIVDLDDWVLTPAQRAFIQSLLSDDDESETDR